MSSLMVVLIVNLIQRSVGFGRAVLFCRWLDPEQLGHWEMAIGFMMLAAPLIVLGLPGSFARYLEKYRTQGRLQLFLRRTASWTFGLTAISIVVMAFNLPVLGKIVFGDATSTQLAAIVVGGLGIVVAHHFLEAVFAGLRLFRVVSTMHFVQSMAFAAFSLSLIVFFSPTAASLVLGYAAACLLSICGVLAWSFWRIEKRPDAADSVPHIEFWPPLMRFAIWIWVSNLLTNVFSVVDRYMILHYGNFTNDEALVQLGNYHTSMIVPVLLVSIANLIVGAMTPHLSHAWEESRQQEVNDRVNFGLKLMAIGMLIAGVGVLFFCPLLFNYAFANKFADGLAVLPWTLAGCVWFSLVLFSQTYVWCAEKSHRASIPLLVGLLSNVLLNILLMPSLGLLGAVVATGVATLLGYLTQLWVNHKLDMRIDFGTILIGFSPLLLTNGPVTAAIGVGLLISLSISTNLVFTMAERDLLFVAFADRVTFWLTRLKIIKIQPKNSGSL